MIRFNACKTWDVGGIWGWLVVEFYGNAFSASPYMLGIEVTLDLLNNDPLATMSRTLIVQMKAAHGDLMLATTWLS